MTQEMEALAGNPGYLSSSPGTHTMEEEDSFRASSD